jgi:hypothetical protein
MRRRTLVTAGAVAAGVLVVALVVAHESGDTRATAPIVAVQPNAVAAARASITGATAPERRAAQAALALVGADARYLSLTFGRCPGTEPSCRYRHATRTLTVQAPESHENRAFDILSSFLAAQVGRDTAGRLHDGGEELTWRTEPYGATGFGIHRVLSPPEQDDRADRAAKDVAERGAEAGWTLAPLRVYRTAGGALVVTVRLGDRALLESRNTSFLTTLYGTTLRAPIPNTLLLIEGPGRALVGGGARDVGAIYGASLPPGGAPPKAPVPVWLKRGRSELRVTIRGIGRPPAGTTYTVRCGGKADSTPAATCTRLLRERAVLFAPVQSDDTCLGAATDESTVTGSVAGIRIRRSFGSCYAGVTAAWEDLLGDSH